MKSIAVKGYAKINLHLDVIGLLEGGFHAVNTVMQSISLFDEICVREKDGEQLSLSCDKEGVPCDEKNLAWRAAELFRETANVHRGFHIDIKKNIPMAAGMAGGSADAAATLVALNRLCDEPLDWETLLSLGSKLGADVPFCIKTGSAFADGKGDRLHPFPSLPENTIILAACGGEGVSTPWAYRTLDTAYDLFRAYEPISIEPLRKALDCGDIKDAAKSFYNIFETPILAERPVAKRIREIMEEEGALRAMMSGSGPSVFGVFDNTESAERAAMRIKETGSFVQITHPYEPKK